MKNNGNHLIIYTCINIRAINNYAVFQLILLSANNQLKKSIKSLNTKRKKHT